MRFIAGESEADRRLDRVLRKMLGGASLSLVYRIIRKNIRVNGKGATGELLLKQGDVVDVLLPDEQLDDLTRKNPAVAPAARKQFAVVFEDKNILVVNKPFGLLTHGDAIEKKNTLTNQVLAYLSGSGGYDPGETNTFAPAPAGRLDRNTTGLVLFGKTMQAARYLAIMLKGGIDRNGFVEKAYLTIVSGKMDAPLTLKARMKRDDEKNVTRILPETSEEGYSMVTEARPLAVGNDFTLVEARLLTGRTHQIRVQLAEAGYPIIGDRKYGDRTINIRMSREYGLEAQLLHSFRLKVTKGEGNLEYLRGKTFKAKPPAGFTKIAEDLGWNMIPKL